MISSCKVAVFDTVDKPFRILETRIPTLKQGEILVKIEYTTLCRSDLLTYSGRRKEKSPTILGHEIVGRIAAFGHDSITHDLRHSTLLLNDRITWAIYSSNPDSEFSKMGIPQKAEDLFKYGHEQVLPDSSLHGGLGEYIILRKNTPVVKVDLSVSLPVVALINCAIATVAGAIRLAGELKGKDVLICGSGMLGVIACAMTKTFGARHVVAMDINKDRLTVAKTFGADGTLLSAEEMHPTNALLKGGNPTSFHVVIDLSGSPLAIETTFDLLRIGATAVWIGSTFPQRKVQINAEQVVRKVLTIKGQHNYNEQDFLSAVTFIEKNHQQYPFEKLIYDGFTLNQVNEAFDYASHHNPFRVGIRIGVPM